MHIDRENPVYKEKSLRAHLLIIVLGQRHFVAHVHQTSPQTKYNRQRSRGDFHHLTIRNCEPLRLWPNVPINLPCCIWQV
jgi:hypothetical protein